MSATIFGIKFQADITPKGLKETIEKSKIAQNRFDGQKFFDAINEKPNIWKKPPKENDSICICNYPYSREMQTWEVTTKSGKEQVCLIWEDEEPYPENFIILDDGKI